ncbi:MAG TPA: hypothetical protein VFE47_23165 [Tepidisphaeraceae bacterium]|jgi:hypothetical protein|nr:hypothetical protein [Tepidisphaeraceae bacterium]
MSLRHRSAPSARISSLQERFSGGISARRKIAAAAHWEAEALEQRVMLTTLHGGGSTPFNPEMPGDRFVFINEDGNFQTIQLFGNITAEVIGANIDGNNNIILENLPGQLNGGDNNGGFNIPGGATLVGTLNVNNPGGPMITSTPSSIAADPNGNLFGIVIQTVMVPPVPPATTATATNLAYLVSIDKNTGQATTVAEISQQILAAAGITAGTPGALVTAAPAATFNPANGLMYVAVNTGVAAAGGAGGAAATTTQSLITINPNAANPAGSVAGIPGTFGGNPVSALGFQNGRLLGAGGMSIFQVNTNNTNQVSGQVTAGVNGPISGIAVGGGGKLFVTTDNAGATSEVYVVDPGSGDAVDYGPLPTGKLGQNPGDLTYDGTNLYSFDTTTDQLFIVSQVNRTRYLSIFQIYISFSDPTGEIFTSQSNSPITSNGEMIPYGNGLTGALRVVNAQTGVVNLIAAPAKSGDALIGARTRIITPGNNPVQDLFPVLTGTITVPVGGTGSPFGNAPYAVGDAITAGVVSAPGTSVGSVNVSGPVMGDVELAGSIDTFYAGWLLTGEAGGEPGLDVVDDPGNFSVGGDIRNLLVSDSIGTDSDSALLAPTYLTGFDMHVGGTVGRVQSFDSIIGNVNTSQSPTAPNLTTNIIESETKTVGDPDPWDAGIVGGGDTAIYNDTFATAQDVGTLPTVVNGAPTAVVVDGVMQADPINADFADYYGVALLAGQTVTCQVVSTPAVLDLGVFNPDGDLIATDYNQVDPAQTQQKQFRFTADRPGVYRFAVSTEGDATFTDPGGSVVGDTPYVLTIQNVGDVAVGGIVATNNILDNVDTFMAPEPSFGVKVGDLGAISAGGDVLSTNPGNTVVILDGSLRDIDAGTVGGTSSTTGTTTTITVADPEVQVPLGSVGLISATSTTGALLFNLQGPMAPAIGGNYQLLSSQGNFEADLIADGSIGVLRAAQMTDGVSIFHVNDDNSTTPGNIDLIDVVGNLGTLAAGGPEILTGPEGNVGYMRVGGIVYRDATFGGSQPEGTLYQPGESVTLTDDSGASVTITPTGTPSIPATGGPGTGGTGTTGAGGTGTTGTGGTGTTGTGGTGTSGSTTGTGGQIVNPNLPQLTVTAYGIEGSGGVAICNITSTGGVTITGSGQESGQTVQIGVVDAQGLGQTINQLVNAPSKTTQPTQPTAPTGTNAAGTGGTTTGTGGTTTGGTTGTGGTTTTTTTAPTFFTGPDTAGPLNRTLPLPNPPVLNPNSASPLNVILTGSARMDAFEVDGGLFSSITDSTGGDIVNVNAASVGTLSSNGQLGLTQNHTGAALNGLKVVANTFPLIDAHNAIIIGTAGGVTPGGAGPINPLTTTTVTNGTTVTTTTAVVTTPAIVTAPILGIATISAAHGIGNVDCGGNGTTVASIGTIQGAILGPVYATGSIYSTILGAGGIATSGTGAGSQAGLYAVGQIGAVTNSVPCDIRGTIASDTGITGIDLKGGSIIFTDIEDVLALNETVQIPVLKAVVPTITPITNPVLDIGNIIVQGNGGIIGTNIGGDHIGHIDVQHGFGIFDTNFSTLGDGTVAGILADGYGLRFDDYFGGSSMGAVVAAGNGQNISTQVYSPDVRYSEIDAFDPNTGFQPNELSDIDISTGATAQVPQVAGFDGGGTDTGVIQDCSFFANRNLTSVRAYQIRATDPATAPSTFNFANSIGTITTLSNDDGLAVITGKLQSFHPGGNIDHLTFQIAGPIKNLSIAGNVTSNSTIAATGRNGNIGKLHVGGSLQGSITAARTISNATIGGNLSGVVSAKQINSLKVVGMLNGGNLDIEGNVKTLQFVHDLGLPDETLTIHGSVKAIKIGGNLNADISVEGNLGTLTVGQSVITGTLTDIAGNLNSLIIDGDFQAGATIQAVIIKHQKIKGLDQGTINA